MIPQMFEPTEAPTEIAARLGLEVVHWLEGVLYARDGSYLYTIGPINPQGKDGAPADLRICVSKAWSWDGSYVGEEYHSPREGAAHAGLTVIEEATPPGEVLALDGFGRKYLVSRTGNGPMASWMGWASAEELQQWAPQHHEAKRTLT